MGHPTTSSPTRTAAAPRRWADAWPDALTFCVGLGMAWHLSWRAADLVWSLWLSSLLVGYALIVWGIVCPAVTVAWRHHRDLRQSLRATPFMSTIGLLVLGVVGLLSLAFGTVHFGLFHYGHSVFLNSFFPVFDGPGRTDSLLEPYLEVLLRYGWFVPLAFVVERAAFARALQPAEGEPGTAITIMEMVDRRLDGRRAMAPFLRPYVNVARMHLLILLLFGVSAANLDTFAVYAAVYALYFFPWRTLFARGKPGPA
jgi:hypothetical protein